jgi:hypothetical protein
LWTSIEANTIIIAACVPTLAPLLDHIFGRRALGSNSRYGPSSGKHSSSGSVSHARNRSASRRFTLDPGSQEEALWTITGKARNDSEGSGSSISNHLNGEAAIVVGEPVDPPQDDGDDDGHVSTEPDVRTDIRTSRIDLEQGHVALAMQPLSHGKHIPIVVDGQRPVSHARHLSAASPAPYNPDET